MRETASFKAKAVAPPPAVQYVTASDGLSIAYAVSGTGTPLLFLPGAAFYHVQLAWEYPGLQHWMRVLAGRFQLIQLDPRGFGMSTRQVPESLARSDYQKDVEAVVEKLKPGPFVLVSASTGVDLALDYASRHPEHVLALVLGTSGVRWATALFDILPSQDWDAFLYSLGPRDRSREELNRIVALRRQSWDQRNYLLQSKVMYGQPEAYAAETERLLSEIRTPTLILHSKDYALIPMEQGIKKAQISGGRLVLLDGSDVWGDADQGMRAIEDFLREVAPETVRRSDPVGATSAGVIRDANLSQRQLEVLRLIAAGKANREIAAELVLSERTVQRHIADIYLKISARNRAEATAYALSHLA
jgi:pimeloyl-ACP methyl ester carboxylesterase/DNA-binding CsgD family transcriptional regulator